MVHREVKADNVFLVGDKRDPYVAKIVDLAAERISEPDDYVPETPFSQRAAEVFRRRARALP